MSVMEERFRAVQQTVEQARAIEASLGVGAAALEALKPALIALASRSELFPPEDFAVPEGATARIYRLAEDADHRFALYASAGVPGKAVLPHNHTTWAVISGVYGEEHNVFYDRIDNRATPGEGKLRKTGELTVVRGNAVAFLPDDFHTIAVTGGEAALHLHLYGLSLEHLPERIQFESDEGGRYRVFPSAPRIRTPEATPQAVKAMLADGEELAILDVREGGVFARSHLLFASSLPLSRLELGIDRLVPRRTARVVVCDDDGGELAQRAAYRLFALGWKNIAVLKGGVAGWRAAGYELFSGVFVPSKAFGELVEHRCDTPRIEAAELKRRLDAKEDVVILDSRPLDEFRAMSIPGGVDCPGAELVYRAFDLVRRPETLVVVNCAGRTRSIIGAQSLINAGLPNRVVALKDGTMGWHLAGFELARGCADTAPPPSPAGLAKAREAAARVGERAGLRRIDTATLARFEAEATRRTLYRFDVRSPEEYAAGHRPGWRSAPGGQLVQATDQYAGTRNARIVLADSDGVRATMTASWLIQMGWEDVYVLDAALPADGPERGPEPLRLAGDAPAVATIAPAAARAMIEAGEAVVVDFATSLEYRAAHIPGAWFAIRARLSESLAKLPAARTLVLTSPDGVVARYAARDLATLTKRELRVLEGGTAAWRAAGLPLAEGLEHLADETEDVWYRPYDRRESVEAAMRDYLKWEVDLPAQIARDGDARFRVLR
ncbi:MAG TPA: rhodanese-like domain-containing protein [Alphaproteobacteria bacterium]|nr:rhodanese-like domain-containing protein [Alphaproteobacteria bacterium]